MTFTLQYPAEELLKDLFLVIDENTKPEKERPEDITPRDAEKMKKKLLKARKRGKLMMSGIDSNWVWRLCAARLMREQFDKPWCFEGWQYRSAWALNHYKRGDEWCRKWKGGNCKLRVLGEQGIGDEILFASTFAELFEECPDAEVEVDSRLLPIMRRSFPQGKFVSRWILGDEQRIPPAPEHYKGIIEKYDAYIPCGDLLPRYRTGVRPPGTPYLVADPILVENYKKKLNGHTIGISWKGGRSSMSPEDLRKQDGTYVSLQYKRLRHNGHAWEIGTDPGPDWMECLEVDHNNMEQVFALVKAMDEVNVTQNYIVHVAGSQGVKCHTVKPPPIFGEVGSDDSDNNRLKWSYGLGGQHPWYQSVRVYNHVREFNPVGRGAGRRDAGVLSGPPESVSGGPRGHDPREVAGCDLLGAA